MTERIIHPNKTGSNGYVRVQQLDGLKLNKEKAAKIKAMSIVGLSGVAISKLFDVSCATISRVITGKTLSGGAS